MKNADRLTLRCQFLVPELPIIMAPKLDKVMGAECQSNVKSTDIALVHVQALTLDAVWSLTDLLEKMVACRKFSEYSLDLQVLEDTVQSAMVLLGNASTQFSVCCGTKSLRTLTKTYSRSQNKGT